MGFPCGSVGKESACNAGDLGLLPELERFPEEGKGYPFQYSVLENSMDYWVHGVVKNWTRLSDFKKNKQKKNPIKLSISHSVQSLSRVRLFGTLWTAARQASLSITNSQSLLKLMSIESVFHPTISSSVVPFSSCLQSFPASGSFKMSLFFISGGQSIGVSASA